MNKEIINFIEKRFSQDCHWLDGNCYWFAKILSLRFPQLEIFYLPIEGHFIVGYQENFYDWRGQIQLKEFPQKLETIRTQDPIWYNRLVRDCIN